MFKNLSLFLCLSLLCLNSGLKTNEDKIEVSVTYLKPSEKEGVNSQLTTENIDYDDPLYDLIIRVAKIFCSTERLNSITVCSLFPADYSIQIYDSRAIPLHPTNRSFYTMKNHHPNEESLSFALNIYDSIKDETDLSRDAYFDRITKMLNAWTYLRPELVPLSKQGPSKKSKWFIPKLFIS